MAEFKFPDEIDGADDKNQDIEIKVENEGDDLEIEIVDDTPENDLS